MLDLNDPEDARRYVATWFESADEAYIDKIPDDDALALAAKFFLESDPRRPLGHPELRH